MSTTSTTTQTNQYNPASMSTYGGLQSGIGGVLNYYMGGGGFGGSQNSQYSPLNTPFFQAAAGSGNKQALGLGASNMTNLAQNAQAFGGGQSTPGFLQQGMQGAGFRTSGLQQQSYWNAIQQAVQNQLGATSQAMSYHPLQTGQTNVTKQSGLGTWLPMVGSLALGALTGGAGFGLTGALLGAGGSALGGLLGMNKGGGGASTSDPTQMGGLYNTGMSAYDNSSALNSPAALAGLSQMGAGYTDPFNLNQSANTGSLLGQYSGANSLMNSYNPYSTYGMSTLGSGLLGMGTSQSNVNNNWLPNWGG